MRSTVRLALLGLMACGGRGGDDRGKEPRSLTLAEAVARGDTSVSASAAEAPDAVDLTIILRRPEPAVIVMAAGTVLTPANPSVQSQMLAFDVRFQLSGTGGLPQQAGQQVETYCLHRFLAIPEVRASLSVETYPTGGGGGGEEQNPVRKLGQCLAERHGQVRHEVRQLAIWMVADGFLAMTPEDVIKRFLAEAHSDLRRRAEQLLDEGGREVLATAFPGAPEEEVTRQLARYRAQELPALLERLVREEIEQDSLEVRPLLDGCGHDTTQSRYFASP